MIDNVLNRKNLSLTKKITIKTAIGLLIVVLAVTLPQIVHLIVGAKGGMMLLPMYLPVLIGGCLLGAKYGAIVGMASPVASFLFTSAFLTPMPALARLPFMMVELAVFGGVSGLFSKAIAGSPLLSFPAVLTAEICGRGVFILMALVLQNFTSLTPGVVFTQIQSGLIGLIAQALLVPLLVMLLHRSIYRGDTENDV